MAGPWRPRHMVNISSEWRLGHADGVELDSPRAQRRWSSFRCSNLALGAWQRGCKRAICGPRRLLRGVERSPEKDSDGQWRPFEIPARPAANPIRKSKVEKRHWNHRLAVAPDVPDLVKGGCFRGDEVRKTRALAADPASDRP